MVDKRTISAVEIERARDYERDGLRPWARVPRDGEEYEAVRDIEIDYLVHWQAPFMGGAKARYARARASAFRSAPTSASRSASTRFRWTTACWEGTGSGGEEVSAKLGRFRLFIRWPAQHGVQARYCRST